MKIVKSRTQKTYNIKTGQSSQLSAPVRYVTKVRNVENCQRVKCGVILQKNSTNYPLSIFSSPHFTISRPPVTVSSNTLQMGKMWVVSRTLPRIVIVTLAGPHFTHTQGELISTLAKCGFVGSD